MATEPRSTHGEGAQASHQAHPAHPAREGKANAGKADNDKKRIAQEREERAKQMAEREKNRGTPTPTQEECDMLKLGNHPELADDGSGPDPAAKLDTVQHIGGTYSHRAMSAKS
jgi:hypothetical protein